MHDEIRRKIVKLHNCTKKHFLYCEEHDLRLETFLQPNNELKNSHEHLIRAMGNELGVTGTPNDEYIKKNLDKSLGHAYRAFFDVCDWLSINLREKVQTSLGPYSNETISAILPDYYITLRPGLDKLCGDIATIRNNKDIGLEEQILAEVMHYDAIIKELVISVDKVAKVIPSLEEHKKRAERETVKTKRWDLSKIIIGAGLAIIGAIIGGIAVKVATSQ